MSTGERFQIESAAPRQGMGTGMKIFLGCGIGCGVICLLCCGGAGGFVWWAKSHFSIEHEAVAIQQLADGIAKVDLPPGFNPGGAIDFRIPIANQQMIKVAVYTGDHEADLLALAEVGDAFAQNSDEALLRQWANIALERNQPGEDVFGDFQVRDVEAVEVPINGENVSFRVEEGKNRAGKRLIRATGNFDATNGKVMVFLQVEADEHPKEQVEQFLRSIK